MQAVINVAKYYVFSHYAWTTGQRWTLFTLLLCLCCFVMMCVIVSRYQELVGAHAGTSASNRHREYQQPVQQ